MTGLYKNTILTKEEAQKLSNLLESGESVTSLWLPGSGRTYLGQALQNTDFLNELLPSNVRDKMIVVYIDQEIGSRFIETHILGNLSQYGSFSMVTEALFSLIKDGHQIVFVIDNFHLDREFFAYLNSLRSVSIDKINFLFMILRSDFEALKREYPDSSSLIYHNVMSVNYFTPKQTIEWAEHTIKKLVVEISNSALMKMVSFTGGIPLLIENYVRFFRIHRNHESVVRSQEMRILLLKLMGLFTKAEREVLENLSYTSSNTFTEVELIILDYFHELGLIDSDNKFIGTWIDQYFNGNRKQPLVVQRGRVYINDVDLTYQFTSSDVELLTLINEKDLVSRDDIHLILTDGIGDDYSDWAIDKFISRLRNKLKKNGISKKTIMTVRGKGYRLKD